MIRALREEFNSKFSRESYDRHRALLRKETGCEIPFRIAESPLFLERDFAERAGREAEALLLASTTAEFQAIGGRAVPSDFRYASETPHPIFSAVDFALTGSPEAPGLSLIELQGFPSLFYFQSLLSDTMRRAYELPAELNGRIPRELSDEAYKVLLREAILGDHDPKDVVLLEIDPLQQKTYVDFKLTSEALGIRLTDIRDLRAVGRELHDSVGPVKRIYNRAIHDELLSKGKSRQISLQFDPRQEYDVEWAGHPNWYFKISKVLLPALSKQFSVVPRSNFLSDNPSLENLEQSVLKPLYSFAGSGVIVSPTAQDIEFIAADQRANWLLQDKVEYAEAIRAPSGFSVKAELRILVIWPEHTERPRAVHTLVRLSRGPMMGVDHNKNLEWVGSSCALIPAR